MKYCPYCGDKVQENAEICLGCGGRLVNQQRPNMMNNQMMNGQNPQMMNNQMMMNGQNPQMMNNPMMNGQNPQANNQNIAEPVDPSLQKSKMAAGLFSIFLGVFGLHDFYLGYTLKGVIHLCLTVFGWPFFLIGPVLSGIWAVVEAVQIFTGSISTDSNGVRLKD